MRASKISSQSNVIYNRNQRVMTAGDMAFQSSFHQHSHQHHQHGKNKNDSKKQRPIKLSTNKHLLIVKGICFKGEKGALIHNHLLQTTKQIQYFTKMKVRNNKYRTSI